MVNLLFFGGLIVGPGILVLIVLGIWQLAGRTIVGAVLGLVSAALVAVIVGPRVILLFVALLFMADDAERWARSRAAEPPPKPAPYERPSTVPDRIGHRLHVKIVLADETGNRFEETGFVMVTVVYDPNARNGIGGASLWTADGPPLNFTVGSHLVTTRWDAKELVDSCLRSSRTPAESDYGEVYQEAARLRGPCHNFNAAQFLLIDGTPKPINWPPDIIVADGRLNTDGAITAEMLPAANTGPRRDAPALAVATSARP